MVCLSSLSATNFTWSILEYFLPYTKILSGKFPIDTQFDEPEMINQIISCSLERPFLSVKQDNP